MDECKSSVFLFTSEVPFMAKFGPKIKTVSQVKVMLIFSVFDLFV